MIKILIFLLIFISPAFAADVYIDPDWGGTESGTFAEPYNSWTDFTITGGNDYRQKCGSTYTGTLDPISNSGSDGNRIIIGAYYDSGGVVHEDDSPFYGETCGNSATKPKIVSSLRTGYVIRITGDYIELNSIWVELGDGGADEEANWTGHAVALTGTAENCHIIYNQIREWYWGIRCYGDDNYIAYNNVYTTRNSTASASPETDYPVDGINIASGGERNIVEYNVVDGAHHFGIYTYHPASSYNEIRYNKVLSTDGWIDAAFGVTGTYNKFHHNYTYRAGLISQSQGTFNEVYYNVISGMNLHQSVSSSPMVSIYRGVTGQNTADNKYYGNVIYLEDNGSINLYGFRFWVYGTGNPDAYILRNEFYNNLIISNTANTIYPIYIRDDNGKIDMSTGADANILMNNVSCVDDTCNDLGYPGNFARIEDSDDGTASYASAAAFNARNSKIDSNIDTDPGLEDITSGKFWPASAGSNVVGAGKDLDLVGTFSDDLFDPNGTDFTTNPITVATVVQPASWTIGAFATASIDVTVVATDADAAEATPATETGTWTITCSPACSGETINFSFSGTAVLDTDYDADPDEGGSIVITGATDTIILVPIDDAAQDIGESATLTITAGTGYTPGIPGSATINITDNDGAQDAGIAGITGVGSGTGQMVIDSSGTGEFSR